MDGTVSIGEHFKRLIDFSGRENKASFWPYAGVAIAIVVGLGLIISVPMMSQAMEQMQEFAAENPDQATITSGPGHYSITIRGEHPSFFPAQSMMLYLLVTFGSAILLYAAAVTRRLRDAGLSGLWGLLPLPFIAYSTYMMPQFLARAGQSGETDLPVFFSIFISNFLYIVSLVVLILLLAKRSKPAA